MEFLRAEGYDQLGDDEKEVLECDNCFNKVKLCIYEHAGYALRHSHAARFGAPLINFP